MKFKSLFFLLLVSSNAWTATSREIYATAIKNGSGRLYVPTVTPIAGRAAIFDGSSVISFANTTSTQIDYLKNVTSDVQSQIDTHTAAIVAHGATGTVMGTTNTQTVTGKSFKADSNNFIDPTDTTKKLKFDLSASSTGRTTTLKVANTGSSDTTFQISGSGSSPVDILTSQGGTVSQLTVDADTSSFTGATGKTLYWYLGAAANNSFTQMDFLCSTAACEISVPNGTYALVGDTISQSLTNKTMGSGSAWNGSAIGATYGGTSQTSWAAGEMLYASGTNTLAKVSAPSVGGQVLQAVGTVPTWDYPQAISRGFRIGDEFLESYNVGIYGAGATSGTGSAVAVLGTSDSTHVGVRRVSTGTTTTGSAALFLNNSTLSLRFGGGTFVWEAIAKLPNLSDGTDTYTVIMGPYAAGGVSETDSTDGAYFRYTNGTNSGKWEFKTANNSVRTTIDTGVTADTNWHRFTIVINAAGTSAQAYIDGVAAGSASSSNIPTTRNVEMGFCMTKSAGTTSRDLYLDAWSIFENFTTPR